MDIVTIRKAKVADAPEITNVHINSWRETYQGLLPQNALDERPLQFKKRYNLWKKVLADKGQETFVAECSDNGVIGIINGGPGKDEGLTEYTEVRCIYLFKAYHGKKLGFNLFKTYFDAKVDKGVKKGYLWVLAGSPTIKFYERVGGEFAGRTKEVSLFEKTVTELCYQWESIQL